MRTGRGQRSPVDLRQATASLRSGHYMKLGDGHLSPRRNDIMGCYPTADGRWSYLHCNFPNHRAAALSVLGVAEDRDAVAAAVANWNAADLEEAIIAAKGAGGMVRTQAEWAQHPQAAAIAALPLMEIVRIGDSPPEALPSRRPPAVRHPRARPDARARRADLRAHPGRAWRRRDEDHRRASAQPRLPGIRHRARQALGAARSARAGRCRDPARAGARGRCVLAGLPARHAGRPRPRRPRNWRRCGRASSMSRSAPSAMPGRGRRGAASTPWCRRSAASPPARPRSCRARRQGPQFYPVSAIDYCTGYLMAFGAMVALARRAEQGGSWLVRISLAQVGKWIVDLGEVPAAPLAQVPDEFSAGRARALVDGEPDAVRPAAPPQAGRAAVGDASPFWARPSVPLGYHRPEWPARGAA